MATKKTTYSASNPSPAQLRARRKFAAAAKARAKAARTVKAVVSGVTRKRNGFWRERLADKVQGKKLKPLRQVAREKVAEKIRGKKNADARDAAHPIAVRKYFRSGGPGYKTQWQRAHEAGQKQLFSVKNPSASTYRLALRQLKEYPGSTQLRREVIRIGESLRYSQMKINADLARAYGNRVMKNPNKKNGATAAKAAFKEFTGKPSRKVSTNYAPKGSGARGTLAAMGKLKKIFVKGRSALDFKGGAAAPTLARDPKTNQMFVLGKGYRLNLPRKNPTGMEDLGEITRIEYECQKMHLGDPQTLTYFHKMGEEGGAKPHCLVNSEGLIVISGGDYQIGAEGIRN